MGGALCLLGGQRLPDVEIIELVKPVHILQHEQIPDSAGAGKFRSGMGHVYKVQYLVDSYDGAAVVAAGIRDYSVPAGLLGGKNLKLHTVSMHRVNDGRIEKLDVGTFCIHYAGDILECYIGAAGGFGNPFEKDVEKVRDDVSNELVSIEGARKDYGVIINPVTLEVDYKATEELRRAHKASES